jgi:hypothetical protein
LRAGDLRLRSVAAAGGLRHVVVTVMLGCSLGRDGSHEDGQSKCDGFHNDLGSFGFGTLNARTGISIRQSPQFKPALPSVPGEHCPKGPRLRYMGTTKNTENLESVRKRKARVIVSEKLRAYFAEIKAGLDADSEDFFQRVMQQNALPKTKF